jgi:hypothetical protein
MKRYHGWNEHRFSHNWYCRDCGRYQWAAFRAWYRGVSDGPYCLRCRDSLAERREDERVLTHDPSGDITG